jgi:hypothetical protein
MPLGGNETQETLRDVIELLTKHDRRLERLETLEFEKYAKSDGCIRWLDYDIQGAVASMRVDVPANPYELGDYGWTHLTVFWALTGAAGTTVRMQINGLAGANYGYNYSWSIGSGIVETAVGAEGQTSMVVGRFISSSYTVGWFHIPYFPIPMWVHTYGDWVTYNLQAEVGTQVERGKFGGVYFPDGQRVMRIDMFASAGNIAGYVYLYGWCPTWSIAHGPPD